MLRVTIHAGDLSTATRFTQRAWIDIGYEKLAQIADYKTVLFQAGFGAFSSWSTRVRAAWYIAAVRLAL